MRKRSNSEITHYAGTKTMKKVAQLPPGLLVDIATLQAMIENFMDLLEQESGPENPRVWKRSVIRRNKKGDEKTYYRWYCSWYDGNKTVTKYLGSCSKMSKTDALEKAKSLKRETLRMQNTILSKE
jgi:hypothetical protein